MKHTSPTWRIAQLVLAGLLLGVGLAAACSSDDRPAYVEPGSHTGALPANNAPCTPGASRSCTVTLGVHDGILSCYKGTQVCVNGAWGPCGDGTTYTEPAPPGVGDEDASAFGSSLQALSAPGDCENNPCDPSCRQFVEQPEAGILPEAGEPVAPWEQGPLDLTLYENHGLTSGKGMKEPCYDATDCQFNRACTEPMTGSACSHGKCVTGAALEPSCDLSNGFGLQQECVYRVCQQKPGCCLPPTGTCVHNMLTVGAALKADCDTTVNSCVRKVCDKIPACCTTTWGANCVEAVASVCSESVCGPGEVIGPNLDRCYVKDSALRTWADARKYCQSLRAGFDLVSVNSAAEQTFLQPLITDSTWHGLRDSGKVSSTGVRIWEWANGDAVTYTNWNPGEPNNSGGSEGCGHFWGSGNSYRWNDQSCTSTRQAICEAPPLREWTKDCVGSVDAICKVKCLEGRGLGKCDLWVPGEVDPSCPTYDLTIAMPCLGGIPVCNHGNTTVTDRVYIAHWPANSTQYPNPDPSLGDSSTCVCFMDEDIPPGECVLTKCDNGVDRAGKPCAFGGNRSIMVNPPTAPTYIPAYKHVPECSVEDNWTMYISSVMGECAPPPCATCDPVYYPTTIRQTYYAACPDAKSPQWGFFAYNTATPAGTTIEFRVGAAMADADLPSPAPYVVATTPVLSPEDCPMTPSGSCPIALHKVLSGPELRAPYLVLEATLTPSGTIVPILEDWRLTYSCVYDL